MPRFEQLLADFTPDFEVEYAPLIPEAEFLERITRLRRAAAVAENEVTLIHADGVTNFGITNTYVQWLCDWPREGILVVPTDPAEDIHLFTFYTESVILPPRGEAVGVAEIWQISPFSIEYGGRAGNPTHKTVDAVVQRLTDLGLTRSSIGLVGDASSSRFWQYLQEELPRAAFSDRTEVLDNLTRILSLNERAQVRTAAQLADVAFQAACHVTRPGVTDFEIYAAFTYAQMARGGETGDGYQIGVNRYGTACGKPYGHVVQSGDIMNLYVSNVKYHGYTAQIARMVAIGDVTERQSTTLEMCADAVKRAEALIRPGARFSELHDAAFSAYVDRGYLTEEETATSRMPYNWDAMPDGSARRVPRQYVADADLEAAGRTLNHVYPATRGPHNPNLGHSVGPMGGPKFNVTSHNTDVLEPGMAFVLHAQWLDPLSDGANIGDMFLVTEDGYENLSSHTPLETTYLPA
ncbi:M24 family metallopeptidase [Rathayibacter sp. VKM Ac-2760]|uniref:M24 family metallopeptidase n=1 Tax=Rathayibacter sp. VKM Ac-2760 TaxID=2609253 RepID=UPI001317BF57|nr:M24 family metallopeptidase [Rathayibacter sp. VKM Ac-2760]QHC60396.1 M24 family metallopeptidase [Rathayibacter sp. VKM Ac-2760]